MTGRGFAFVSVFIVCILVVPMIAGAAESPQLSETAYIYLPLILNNFDGMTGGGISRVSISSEGGEGSSNSHNASLSSDGRYVVFVSEASDLVLDDANGYEDVFVHDQQTGTTSLVSLASDGTQGNGYSWYPDLSDDGRFVTFMSNANNLVADDTNGLPDIFLHDLNSGETSLISVATDGTHANSLSFYATISGEGRYIAFESLASNLVPSDTNGSADIFVHDTQSGDTYLVSVASDGTQANGGSSYPDISSDGRFITFGSGATNLVPDDTNGEDDIFFHDRQTGETTLISAAWDGALGNGLTYFPRISSDGRYVSFQSQATNLVPDDANGEFDVFVRDRQTGDTILVSKASNGTHGNAGSFHHAISADGHTVAFVSSATNLVPGDMNGWDDIFVHDLLTGETELVSKDDDGTQGNGDSARASISASSHYVVFDSAADNLVPNDTNSADDVFVHDLGD